MQRGTVADNFATRFWADHGVELVRYARQEEAYLDLSAGRIDASWSTRSKPTAASPNPQDRTTILRAARSTAAMPKRRR